MRGLRWWALGGVVAVVGTALGGPWPLGPAVGLLIAVGGPLADRWTDGRVPIGLAASAAAVVIVLVAVLVGPALVLVAKDLV
jgi:hypothetical protein